MSLRLIAFVTLLAAAFFALTGLSHSAERVSEFQAEHRAEIRPLPAGLRLPSRS